MLSKYCYGPVTIIEVIKHEISMEIVVQSSHGHSSKAEYQNCIYWQIDKSLEGKKLLIVEEKSAEELIQMRDNPCVSSLKQNAASVENLILQWKEEGMHFYVHYAQDAKKEYLVVSKDFQFIK